MRRVTVVFLMLIPLGSCWASQICGCVVIIKFGKLSVNVSLDFLFLPLSGIPFVQMLENLVSFNITWILYFFKILLNLRFILNSFSYCFFKFTVSLLLQHHNRWLFASHVFSLQLSFITLIYSVFSFHPLHPVHGLHNIPNYMEHIFVLVFHIFLSANFIISVISSSVSIF